MPVLTLYRSVRSLGTRLSGGWWEMSRAEVDWEPRPAVDWGGQGWAHSRSAPEPIAVRVPAGAKLADLPAECEKCRDCHAGRRIRRLVRKAGDPGLDAAAVLYLAERGEGNFGLEQRHDQAKAG